MVSRTRNLIFLAVGAASAGVYLELQRHHEAGTLGGPALPSASVSAPAAPSAALSAALSATPNPPSIPAQAPPTRAQAEAALTALRAAVRLGLSDPKSPWALSHGLLGLGKDHALPGGERATARLGALLQRSGSGWSFPPGTETSPGEPHPHSVLADALEAGVPQDTLFRTASGELSLRDWLTASIAGARAPVAEAEWVDAPWLITLALHAEGPAAESLKRELQRGALTALTRATQPIADYQGPPERAFASGSPLQLAKRDKLGIYRHHCGGLHFTDAVLRLYRGDAGSPSAVEAELERLAKRFELERPMYDALARGLAMAPDAQLLIAVQRLKFYGHTAEVLGGARRLELVAPGSELGARLDQTLAELAGELVRLVPQLERIGYARAEALKASRPQTYLDLMGDGAHAARGLERALDVLK